MVQTLIPANRAMSHSWLVSNNFPLNTGSIHQMRFTSVTYIITYSNKFPRPVIASNKNNCHTKNTILRN